MKQLRHLLILLCCCFPLWGQAYASTTDSLQQVLQTLPHDSTRLKAIQQILKIEQANSKCIQFSDLLFKEATQQNDPKYVGIAIYFQIIYYYNQNNLDSVSKRLVSMEPYAKEANLWDYYFDGMRCLLDLYSYREQFELTINKSAEMKKKAEERNSIRGQIGAYQCLSNAYLGTGRMKKAKQSLKEAHKLLPQLKNIAVHSSVLTQLVSLSYEMKDYADLIRFLKEQKKLLATYITSNPHMKEAFSDVLLFNEIYYTYYYNTKKQKAVSLQHLMKAGNYLTDNTYFMYQILYHDAYADYYRLDKEYDKALACMDSTVIKLQDSFNSDYFRQLGKKADILAEAGRKQEALLIYQQVLHAKDSLERSLSDKQMELIQKDYHIDKLRLEKEQARNKVQLIALAVILLAFIVLLLFMARIFYIQKALKVSEQQTRKATQTAEEANEMKNRFLSNMSYNIRIPLNGVVGFSQLIAMDSNMDEETRGEYSAIIQQNSKELMRLVNDVLDLSRLEANMMKFQMQQYDIVSLCNDAIYMARDTNEKQIDIQFHHDLPTIQNLTADTARLIQALLSTLIYPQPREEKRTILFTLTQNTHTTLQICINNTPLADPDFQSQEVSIRHDINRLLLEHFGGTYTVMPDASEGPTIVFTYPLSVSE